MVKRKEKNLQAVGEKAHYILNTHPHTIRITANFSSETTEAREHWYIQNEKQNKAKQKYRNHQITC